MVNMHIIQKLLLLLTLSQLGACAVISKEQCLNADWQKIGYNVGKNGNLDKSTAFEKRKRACEKHNASANWQQFERGHSDGIVAFCQLNNAVELGINGSTNAINNNICSERDYPGFQNAFKAGYKLYVLNSRVDEADSGILLAENQISHYKKSLHVINKKISSKAISKKELSHLLFQRKKLRSDIKHLIYDIDSYHQHLDQYIYDRDQYADYLYYDYKANLSDDFIDPRKNRNSKFQY